MELRLGMAATWQKKKKKKGRTLYEPCAELIENTEEVKGNRRLSGVCMGGISIHIF